jgi:hypothetical protein
MKHSGVLRIARALSLAAVLAGCGSTTTPTVTVVETTTVTVAANPTPTTTALATSGAAAQSVQDFHGNTPSVTADRIIDPAQPSNPDATPTAGTRLVAVELTLKGEGPGTITSDANSNVTALGSDGQAYTFSADPVTGCTNFSSGNYTVLAGNSERGCVVIQVPTGVTIKAVQFSLGNGTAQFNH